MGIIALKCPQCGADIQLDDSREFGFCSFCGTKVMQEKIVVEHKGTVKIDNSDYLENLYNLARRSLECEEYKSAEDYYKKILLEDSNSAEAAIYSLVCEGRRIHSYKQIPAYVVRLSKCMNSLFELVEYDEKYLEFLVSVNYHVTDLCAELTHEILTPTYMKFKDNSSQVALNERMEISDIYLCLATTIALYLRRTELFCMQSPDSKFGGFTEEQKETINGICEMVLLIRQLAMIAKKNDGADCSKIIADAKEFHSWAVSKGFDVKLPEDFSEAPKVNNTGATSQESKGGCYVATAVYGSYDCPQVWTLRRYRDNVLAKTWYGRAFIRMYYAVSPTLVKWFGDTDWFKNMWKGKLDRMVADFRNKGIESTPYEDKNW